MQYGYDNLAIDKNIPIPKSKRGAPKGTKSSNRGFDFLLEDMEIGDSFAIPLKEKRDYQKYYQCVMKSAKKSKIKITCRNLGKEIRFWKIEE